MKSPLHKLPLLLLAGLFLLMNSCVSRKDIAYFQNLDKIQQDAKGEAPGLEIKPNDLLTINVSAPEQAAAIPFNLPVVSSPENMGGENMNLSVSARQQMQTYLVDSDGNIQFPILGTLKVEGFNRQQLAAKLEDKITAYVQDPIVNVRIVNFEVSILGEVARPGTFDIVDEYLSLPKALGLAGDLTIYGQRDNILVMREENGIKTHAYLDLTDAGVINSPYYYLKQNDVVYVEPNGAQRQSANYNRNAGVYISIASVLISLIVLITK